jgi:hypothetical protein
MDYYSIFYWLTVADGVKSFFDVASNLFTWAASLALIGMVISLGIRVATVGANGLKSEEEEKENPEWRAANAFFTIIKKFFYTALFLSLITWMGYMLTPTKKDCLLIVAGGAVGNFITTDSSAKQLPADVTNFLHMSLQEQMKEIKSDVKEQVVSDAKKQLGMQTPKEELMDKVKKMTKEEIINYLQSDTAITKKQ